MRAKVTSLGELLITLDITQRATQRRAWPIERYQAWAARLVRRYERRYGVVATGPLVMYRLEAATPDGLPAPGRWHVRIVVPVMTAEVTRPGD